MSVIKPAKETRIQVYVVVLWSRDAIHPNIIQSMAKLQHIV